MSAPDTMAYQCEHCEMWQIEYSVTELLDAYGEVVVGKDGELGVNPAAMHEAINYVVREHLREYHPWVK
jgi:hypothetical protein